MRTSFSRVFARGELFRRDACADMSSMPTADEGVHQDALEPPAFTYDRRKSSNRRNSWRGGRRDSDWINRPPGALARFEKLQRRATGLRRFVMSFW